MIDRAEQRLDDAAKLGTRSTIAMVSTTAPPVDAATIAAAFGARLQTLWRDGAGDLFAGAGLVSRTSADGPRRFERARDGARDLFARIAGEALLFGGFAFAAGGERREWRGFGDASFELARLSYRRRGAAATLSVAVEDPLDPRSRARGIAALEAALESLTRARRTELARGATVFVDDPQSARRYLALVSRAAEEIRAGSLTKVVVARCADAAITTPLPALLGSLDAAYPSCTLLVRTSSWGRDAGVLIAASPERLVKLSGERVMTAALAGTAPRAGAGELFSSSKLQHEHRLTSDHIAAALAGAGCAAVEIAPQRLRTLGDLAHLETPITARRPPGAHLFDLAAALHPTPAVAGIPTAGACRFIDDAEAMDRGWYAGPVGWLDRRGDGELAVALRAGLVRGERITLYAGAGIVRESDPAEELAETSLKLGALGAKLAGGAA